MTLIPFSAHFISHGLHYSRLGKMVIGNRLIYFINNFRSKNKLIHPPLPKVQICLTRLKLTRDFTCGNYIVPSLAVAHLLPLEEDMPSPPPPPSMHIHIAYNSFELYSCYVTKALVDNIFLGKHIPAISQN